MKNLITATTVFVALFLLAGCQKDSEIKTSVPANIPSKEIAKINENQPVQNNQVAPSETVPGDWQTYKNEKYGYQVKYPDGWYFMEDACCPPPPAFVSLNNFSSKRSEYSANQMESDVYGVSILCLYEGSIDEIGEVQSYQEEGLTGENTTINSSPAIKFERNVVPGDDSENVITYYIVDGQQGCRVTYTDKCPVCDKIVQTFVF